MNTKTLAWQIRKDAIEMVHASHASHIGAALSVADIVAVLYGDVAKTFPKNPKSPERDRIVLSKGHAGVAIYAALAETGFFPKSELQKYYTDASVYSGHVSSKGVPGVEFSTGSLGHGVCVACGMALAGKKQNKNFHVYAIVGDGECEEGCVWETAIFANHYKLSNFTVIVDNNKMQAMGTCEDVMSLGSLAEKFRAFGWNVIEVDGHNHDELKDSLMMKAERPTAIIAHTVKGKGVSFMENNLLWHYRDPQGEFYEQAIKELEAQKP